MTSIEKQNVGTKIPNNPILLNEIQFRQYSASDTKYSTRYQTPEIDCRSVKSMNTEYINIIDIHLLVQRTNIYHSKALIILYHR